MTALGSRLPSGLRCTQGGAGAVLGGRAGLANPDEGEGGAVTSCTQVSTQQYYVGEGNEPKMERQSVWCMWTLCGGKWAVLDTLPHKHWSLPHRRCLPLRGGLAVYRG